MAPTNFKRGPWAPAEDMWLLKLVENKGAQNWVLISQTLSTRSPKQCRERFHQNLKPSLDHSPITQEEGDLIERLVGEMGKRWAEIARRLNGRSDNAVKNWWNGGMNRRKRLNERRRGSSFPGGVDMMDVHQQVPSALHAVLPMHQSRDRDGDRRMDYLPQHPMVLTSRPSELTLMHQQYAVQSQSHDYRNPYAHSRPHQTIMIPDRRARVEPSQISPGNPPSLIEDTGSQMSPSPQLARPPPIQSPGTLRHDDNIDSQTIGISPITRSSPLDSSKPSPRFSADALPMRAQSNLRDLANGATNTSRAPDLVHAPVRRFHEREEQFQAEKHRNGRSGFLERSRQVGLQQVQHPVSHRQHPHHGMAGTHLSIQTSLPVSSTIAEPEASPRDQKMMISNILG